MAARSRTLKDAARDITSALSAGEAGGGMRKALFAAVVGFLLVTAASTGATLWFMRTERIESATHINKSLALVIQEQTAEVLAGAERTLSRAAERLAWEQGVGAIAEEAARAALRASLANSRFLRAIFVLDARGRIAFDSDIGNIGVDLSDRQYFRVHRDDPKRGLHMGDPVVSRSVGTWFVSISLPLLSSDGRFDGVIVAALELLNLEKVWGGVDIGENGSIALVRRDGTLYMRSPYREGLLGKTYPFTPYFTGLMEAAPAGSATTVSPVDGKIRIVSYRVLPAHPDLVLLVGRSMDLILAPWRRGVAVAVAIWLASAAAVGAFAFWLQVVWRREQTGQERVGKELRESESVASASVAEFRALFDHLPVGISESTVDGRIIAVNAAWRRMYGYGATDAVAGIDAAGFWADSSDRARMFDQLAGEDHAAEVEALRNRRDGTKFLAELHTRGTVDADGKLQKLRSIHLDITDRKRREELAAARHAAEAKYSTMFDTMPVGVMETGPDGSIIAANPAARRMFGFGENEDLSGVSIADRYADPADRARIFAEHLRAGGKPMRFEVRRRRRDGSVFWAEQHVSADLDAGGRPALLHSAIVDITDRKLREEQEAAARAMEAGYRALVDEIPVGILETTPDGDILTANPAWRRMYGFAAGEDLSAHNVREIYADPGTRDGRLAELRRANAPVKIEIHARRRDGAEFWAEVHASAILRPDGQLQKLRGVHLDITDRKLRERQKAARRATEANYGALIAASSAAIIALDNAGNVTVWNPAAEKLFGYAAREVLGKPLPTVVEDQREEFERGLRRVMSGETLNDIQRVRRTKDGRLVAISTRVAPIFGSDGKQSGSIAVVTDLTERLALADQLRQAQKMEAVGQLTGGIAHDFNNLLTVILGSAETLSEELADDPRLRRLAEMTGAAAQRGAELTKNLLAFSRKQSLEPKPTDINALVSRLKELLRRTLGEQTEIKTAPGKGLWAAMTDPAQLETALLNLAVNARDAMPGGGKLVIETANIELDQDYARANHGVVPGPYVMIAVSDTGEGMTPEVLAKAFDPFFTTKEVGKGTGLGLSMVYGFVKQSNGYIKLYSEPGHGTTVKLYLPRAAGAAGPDAASARPAEMRGGDETVLVAEDDELVRTHVASLLTGLGYRVLAARNGPEALDVLRQDRKIDLLLTDVVMTGGMNGMQLAEAAQRLRPALKVLFTSGYPGGAIAAQGKHDSRIDLLSKPYQRHELAAKLRMVLKGKRPGL